MQHLTTLALRYVSFSLIQRTRAPSQIVHRVCLFTQTRCAGAARIFNMPFKQPRRTKYPPCSVKAMKLKSMIPFWIRFGATRKKRCSCRYVCMIDVYVYMYVFVFFQHTRPAEGRLPCRTSSVLRYRAGADAPYSERPFRSDCLYMNVPMSFSVSIDSLAQVSAANCQR